MKKQRIRPRGFEWMFASLIACAAIGSVHQWSAIASEGYTQKAEIELVSPYKATESEAEAEKTDIDTVQPRQGVLTPSELTAEELASGLYAPLSDYAYHFIQAEKETGINAVFLASVAAYESGWGKYAPGYNLFGWGGQSFGSVAECVDVVANRLKDLYLTPGGAYFSGYEVEDINRRYNGRESWAVQVKTIMGQIENRIENERSNRNGHEML